MAGLSSQRVSDLKHGEPGIPKHLLSPDPDRHEWGARRTPRRSPTEAGATRQVMLGGLEPFRDRYSLSSVTVLSPLFATQAWVPSEETPSGPLPTPSTPGMPPSAPPTGAPVEASSSPAELPM